MNNLNVFLVKFSLVLFDHFLFACQNSHKNGFMGCKEYNQCGENC
jgi:hypothetical protein